MSVLGGFESVESLSRTHRRTLRALVKLLSSVASLDTLGILYKLALGPPSLLPPSPIPFHSLSLCLSASFWCFVKDRRLMLPYMWALTHISGEIMPLVIHGFRRQTKKYMIFFRWKTRGPLASRGLLDFVVAPVVSTVSVSGQWSVRSVLVASGQYGQC